MIGPVLLVSLVKSAVNMFEIGRAKAMLEGTEWVNSMTVPDSRLMGLTIDICDSIVCKKGVVKERIRIRDRLGLDHTQVFQSPYRVSMESYDGQHLPAVSWRRGSSTDMFFLMGAGLEKGRRCL